MFDRAERTLKALDLLRGCNDVLTYEAIENTMGETIDDLRQVFINARRYLERDEGIVFECVRKVGFRRLTDSEKVESSSKFRRTIRRNAIRGVTRCDAVKAPDQLSNKDQMRLTIQRTVFQAIQRESAE